MPKVILQKARKEWVDAPVRTQVPFTWNRYNQTLLPIPNLVLVALACDPQSRNDLLYLMKNLSDEQHAIIVPLLDNDNFIQEIKNTPRSIPLFFVKATEEQKSYCKGKLNLLEQAIKADYAKTVEAVRTLYSNEELQTVLAKTNDFGQTLLYEAVTSEYSEFLSAFMKLYPSDEAIQEQLTRSDAKGQTPLHQAAKGRLYTGSAGVKLLAKYCTTAELREKVMKPDNKGRTPLHIAVEKGGGTR